MNEKLCKCKDLTAHLPTDSSADRSWLHRPSPYALRKRKTQCHRCYDNKDMVKHPLVACSTQGRKRRVAQIRPDLSLVNIVAAIFFRDKS